MSCPPSKSGVFVQVVSTFHLKLSQEDANSFFQPYALRYRCQVKNLEDVVLQFTLGRGDVLLATSIIENGIDMPNVNSIVVMVRACCLSVSAWRFLLHLLIRAGDVIRRVDT